MIADDGEAAPPIAPAYYRGRALPMQPVGTTAAAAADTDTDTDTAPVSAHLFSSRCVVRHSADDEWNRRRASTQAHVDATLRRSRYAAPPSATPSFVAAIAATSSPAAPQPQPPVPTALEESSFSSCLSVRPGQPLPYTQTLWAGSYSSRPASAARLARASSPSPSARAPRPERSSALPAAPAAQDIYRKPAQASVAAFSIPTAQANPRRPASASPAYPPHQHHGATAPVRPSSARATAPHTSRFIGARLGQGTSRASAYDVSSSVAAAVAPLRPSSAVRAAEAQRRSSARLADPSPPRSTTPASAVVVAAPPAPIPHKRPGSARPSAGPAHRDAAGGWQRPHTAHHTRRTPVPVRDKSPTPAHPLASRDETTAPAPTDAADCNGADAQPMRGSPLLSQQQQQQSLPARSVSDSSPPSFANVAEHALTARAASPAAGAPSYFAPSSASAAMPLMSLRLPPSHTASAANTARQRPDAATGRSSRAVSSERTAGGAGGGGGRLHSGSTVPSTATTARGSTSQRGSSTTRSTASSMWPPSTIPSARFGATDYPDSAEDSQQAHAHAHPLSALSVPGAPVLPSGEGARALLESLRDDLHRLCKQNDIEGALLCVQKLQLYRWRHSEGHGDLLALLPADQADDERADSAGASAVASGSGLIWDVRLLCDRSGSTPLFHASWLGLLPVARLLLSSGLCPVSHRNVRGNSALDMAIERSNLPMVRLLLAHGAKLSSASPHFVGLGADATAAAIAAARVDVDADPGPASGTADLRRLEALGARATYEISPRVQALLRTRAATPHKALKMAYYARAGAAVRLESLFESNPRSAARWAQDLCAGGLSALGLAARFGHARVAHLLLERGGVDVHAECVVRQDGRMLEEGDDDEEEDTDSDSDSDSASEHEHDLLVPSSRRSKRMRTRTTNAFALAVEHGHYLLALELHERWGARIDHSSEVRVAVASGTTGHNHDDGDEERHSAASASSSSLVRSSLLLMQRMATLSLSLQHRLLESWQQSRGCDSDTSAQLDPVRSWLEAECGPGAEGARLRAAVVAYPDRHGRCALHVAVALQMPPVLDYLLEQGGFRDAAAASKRTAADAAGAAGPAPWPASSPSDPISSSREHLRHLTLLQLASETNNLTLVYLLLSHGGRLSLADAIRALDRKAYPHSRLDESNGLLLISYAMEQQRNEAREERARRDYAHTLACAVALARGEPPPPLPPLRCAVMSPDDLVALLNSTSIGVDLARRILQTLLPAMADDAAESGAAPLSLDVGAYLRRLHAWQLAQGRAVLSPEDEAAAAAAGAGGLSSGYGQASTGLLSARGAHGQNPQRQKNRLHDASYLARLLARQRAHAARHALLWSEAQGSPEEQRAEAADRSALRRMEGAMLTPRRIQQLLRLHAELVGACADAVPLPPTEADLLAAEHDRVEGLHRDDMTGERAERHRAGVRAAQAAARAAAAAAAALAPQPTAGVELTADGGVDWVALSRRPSSTLASSSTPAAEHPDTLRARLCFQMAELLTYNPRLRLGLGVGVGVGGEAGGGAGGTVDDGSSFLVPSSIPGSGVVGQRFASRRHTASSWVRAWQEQAWDEGLHSVDVLLREYGRRRDRKGVRRADWVPLAFLWPNRYSQEQAARSAARRSARSIRVAERQARRARLVAGKDSAAASAAAAAISAAMDAQAGGAAVAGDFLQGAVGQLLLGAHFDSRAAGGSGSGGGGGGGVGVGVSSGFASNQVGAAADSSVSAEAAALALRMREELAAQFGCDVSPWSSQSQAQQAQWPSPPHSVSAHSSSPSPSPSPFPSHVRARGDGLGMGGAAAAHAPGAGGAMSSPPVGAPLPSLDSLLASRTASAPPAAPLLYSPRMLAMAQAAEVIARQKAVMRNTEVDTPAWVRSR